MQDFDDLIATLLARKKGVLLSDTARSKAAEELGRLRDQRAVDSLIAVLEDTVEDVTWSIQVAAATALGQIGDIRAVDPLIKALLRSRESPVRASAARALGLLKDQRAIPALTARLNDQFTERATRLESRRALQDITGNEYPYPE